MSHKNSIFLTPEQEQCLRSLVSSGHAPARKLTRARILLLTSENAAVPMTDEDIAEALDVSRAHVQNTRRCFFQEGLEPALVRKPQPARPDKRRLDGAAEAHLIALACSQPPEGRVVWTMQLLADKMVSLGYCEGISDETVRIALKKTNSNHGRKKSGVFHLPRMQRSFAVWKTS